MSRLPKPPSRPPRDFGAHMVDDLIDGAVNNEFGRPVNVEYDGPAKFHSVKHAEDMGARAALKKFAVDGHALQELVGLGLLTPHLVHEITGDSSQDSPMAKKLYAGSELAGLGMLAQPYASKLLK